MIDMKKKTIQPTVENTLEMLIGVYEHTKKRENEISGGLMIDYRSYLNGKKGITYKLWTSVLSDKGIIQLLHQKKGGGGNLCYCWVSKLPDKEMASAVLIEAKKQSPFYVGGIFLGGHKKRKLYSQLPQKFDRKKAKRIAEKLGMSTTLVNELLRNKTFIQKINHEKYRKKINCSTAENKPTAKLKDNTEMKRTEKTNTDRFIGESAFVIFEATATKGNRINANDVLAQYTKLQMFGETGRTNIFIGVLPVKHYEKTQQHFDSLKKDFKKLDINIDLINSFQSKVSNKIKPYDGLPIKTKKQNQYIYLFWGLIKLKVRSK